MLDVTQRANRCGTWRWKPWEDCGERREVTNKERIKEVKVAVDDRWVRKKLSVLERKRQEGQRRGEGGKRKRRQADCVCVCAYRAHRQRVTPLRQSGCSTVLRPSNIIQPFRHVKFPNAAL